MSAADELTSLLPMAMALLLLPMEMEKQARRFEGVSGVDGENGAVDSNFLFGAQFYFEEERREKSRKD